MRLLVYKKIINVKIRFANDFFFILIVQFFLEDMS